MKTQIATLINGRMNVVRDLTSEKYEGINEIVGTNSTIRKKIARKVLDENPDGMDVEVKGIRLHLGRYASCSGKTIWYNVELTHEQYIAITGNEFPDSRLEWCAYFDVDMSMIPRVTRFSRRNERSVWKEKMSIVLDEAFVTIL